MPFHGAVGSSEGTVEVKFKPGISQNAAVGTSEPMTLSEGWLSAPVKMYVPSKLVGDKTAGECPLTPQSSSLNSSVSYITANVRTHRTRLYYS